MGSKPIGTNENIHFVSFCSVKYSTVPFSSILDELDCDCGVGAEVCGLNGHLRKGSQSA